VGHSCIAFELESGGWLSVFLVQNSLALSWGGKRKRGNEGKCAVGVVSYLISLSKV